MSANMCDYCGRLGSADVITEDAYICRDCYSKHDTCALCENGYICSFETDPSPLPKVVMQTIRRGNMTMQTQVKNPERFQAFCLKCECFNKEENICGKEDSWCKNYKEITPRFRQKRFENI